MRLNMKHFGLLFHRWKCWNNILFLFGLLIRTGLSYDCSVVYPTNTKYGIIQSPNFPHKYPNSVDCTYSFSYFSVSGSNKICLYFRKFDVEYNREGDNCLDYIEIVPTGQKICGATPYFSNSLLNNFPTFCFDFKSSFKIKFLSDRTKAEGGFFANFTVTGMNGNQDCDRVRPSQCFLNCNRYKQDEKGCAMCECREMECNYEGGFHCFNNRKCIPRAKVCDGIDNCGDFSDESYELTGHIDCERKLGNIGSTFDRYFSNYDSSSSFGWKIMDMAVRPTDNYPVKDHTRATYSGGYAYTTLSAVKPLNQAKAVFQFNSIPRTGLMCISFWYYLPNMHSIALAFEQNIPNTDSWLPLWQHSGDWGKQWQQGQVLFEQKYSKQYTLRFAGYEHLPYSDSVIALDDLSLMMGNCNWRDMSCKFEVDNQWCGWKTFTSHDSQTTWKIYDKIYPDGVFSVSPDGDFNGKYGSLTIMPTESEEVKAILESDFIINYPKKKRCFNFDIQIWMAGEQTVLRWDVYQITDQGYAILNYGNFFTSNSTAVKTRVFNTRAWDKAFKVQIVFQLSRNVTLFAAIDNIEWGICSFEALVSPASCDIAEHRCKDGTCLPTRKRCDGVKDCIDGTDEMGCPVITPEGPGFYSSKTGIIIGVVLALVATTISVCSIFAYIASRKRRLAATRAREQARALRLGLSLNARPISSVSTSVHDSYSPPPPSLTSSTGQLTFVDDSCHRRGPIPLQPPSYYAIFNAGYSHDVPTGSMEHIDSPPSYEYVLEQDAIPSYDEAIALERQRSQDSDAHVQSSTDLDGVNERDVDANIGHDNPALVVDDTDSGVVNCDDPNNSMESVQV